MVFLEKNRKLTSFCPYQSRKTEILLPILNNNFYRHKPFIANRRVPHLGKIKSSSSTSCNHDAPAKINRPCFHPGGCWKCSLLSVSALSSFIGKTFPYKHLIKCFSYACDSTAWKAGFHRAYCCLKINLTLIWTFEPVLKISNKTKSLFRSLRPCT